MLNNLKISAKMTIAFAIILLPLIGSLIFAVISLGNATLQLSNLKDKSVPILEEIAVVYKNVEAVPKNLYWALMSQDPQIAETALGEVAKSQADFLAAYEILASHELGIAEIDQIGATVATADDALAEVIALIQEGTDASFGQAYVLLVNEAVSVFDEALALVDTANAKIDDHVDNLIAGYTAQATTATYILIAAAVLTTLLAIIFATLLIRSITKPLVEVAAAAGEMAKGNLTNIEIKYNNKDEIGIVAESLRASISTIDAYIKDITKATTAMANSNFQIAPSQPFVGDFQEIETSMLRFADEISSTLGQISIASEQVSSGSDQVSSGAQSLAQGATEQASSVEELSISVGEISEQVKLNAENSLKANKMAELATNAITSSNQQMQQLKVSMSEIDTKSKEINKIIKTIEDISFQTNILALNAAVEAAKAGSAGKGFAVVAEEVRNLAGKSAEAAKTTTDLIESSVMAIAQGVKYTESTADDLNAAVENVVATNSIIAEITQASNEQAAAITQITIGLDQISAVVQTNSATSEESAAASEELSSQANLLKQLLSRFVLKNTNTTTMFAPTPNKLALPDTHETDSYVYNDEKY